MVDAHDRAPAARSRDVARRCDARAALRSFDVFACAPRRHAGNRSNVVVGHRAYFCGDSSATEDRGARCGSVTRWDSRGRAHHRAKQAQDCAAAARSRQDVRAAPRKGNAIERRRRSSKRRKSRRALRGARARCENDDRGVHARAWIQIVAAPRASRSGDRRGSRVRGARFRAERRALSLAVRARRHRDHRVHRSAARVRATKRSSASARTVS